MENDILDEFKNKYVDNILKEYYRKYEDFILSKGNEIQEVVIKALKELCHKVKEYQDENDEHKVLVFQFALLRSGIVNENYKMLLIAYNGDWYLDENPITIEVDMRFLFHYLKEIEKELIIKSKEYMGKINKYHIIPIILDEAMRLGDEVCLHLRFIFQNIDQECWFREINKNEDYYIRFGEYQDKSEVIFAGNTLEKNSDVFLEKLKENDKKEKNLIYSAWNDSKLNDLEAIKKDMIFSSFKRGEVKNCNFNESILLGASFNESDISNCSFKKAILKDANFSKSKLSNVDFQGANLKGSNFIGAVFYEVSFEDAELDFAVFSEKDVPYLKISPQQLQTMYMVGDKQ